MDEEGRVPRLALPLPQLAHPFPFYASLPLPHQLEHTPYPLLSKIGLRARLANVSILVAVNDPS